MDCIANRENQIKYGNYSSELAGNFTEKDLGKPILDTVLDPGDLLYFPRGTIHQVNSFSCYSKNCIKKNNSFL